MPSGEQTSLGFCSIYERAEGKPGENQGKPPKGKAASGIIGIPRTKATCGPYITWQICTVGGSLWGVWERQAAESRWNPIISVCCHWHFLKTALMM